MYRSGAEKRKRPGMADENAGTLETVKKIVGKSYKPGKIDAQLAALAKLTVEYNKSGAAFRTALTALETSIPVLQDGNSKATNQLKQVSNNVAAADFGLDPSKPDDKEKIDQCKTLLTARCNELEKHNDARNKTLDELDKHVDTMSSYKSGG